MMNLEQARKLLELTLFEYSKVRATYHESLRNTMTQYMEEPTKDDNWFRDAMRAAVLLAFGNAMLIAWQDGGGVGEVDVSIVSFIAASQMAELGFVESLLVSLRFRKTSPPSEQTEDEEFEAELDLQQTIQQHADGYARTLDRMYNNAKVMAAKDKILIFAGSDGEESCFHCQAYKGKKHPASWWFKNDAVPPNRRFECKGYRCMHVLVDESGFLFTI